MYHTEREDKHVCWRLLSIFALFFQKSLSLEQFRRSKKRVMATAGDEIQKRKWIVINVEQNLWGVGCGWWILVLHTAPHYIWHQCSILLDLDNNGGRCVEQVTYLIYLVVEIWFVIIFNRTVSIGGLDILMSHSLLFSIEQFSLLFWGNFCWH